VNEFLAWSANQPALVVIEKLRPCVAALFLVRSFLANVALPVLKAEHQSQKSFLRAVLCSSTPSVGIGLGKLEEKRQHDELVRVCQTHLQNFVESIKESQSVVANLEELKTGELLVPFKSRYRREKLILFIPPNHHNHLFEL
jgi:hypothetical protein